MTSIIGGREGGEGPWKIGWRRRWSGVEETGEKEEGGGSEKGERKEVKIITVVSMDSFSFSLSFLLPSFLPLPFSTLFSVCNYYFAYLLLILGLEFIVLSSVSLPLRLENLNFLRDERRIYLSVFLFCVAAWF